MSVSFRTKWALMSLSTSLIAAGCGTASSQSPFFQVRLTGRNLPHHAEVNAFLKMTLVNHASRPITFNAAHLRLQHGRQVYYPGTQVPGPTLQPQPGHRFFWIGMMFLLPKRLCGSTLSGHVGHLPGTMQATLSCSP